MTFLLIAFLGGALTVISPCVLPVLPFVFARAGQPFLRGALPMLAGMALTFALAAAFGVAGGAWVVQASEAGRYAAMALLALFALTLLSPRLGEFLSRPAVALGNRLAEGARRQGASEASALSLATGSFMLGAATGLLWTPCAGPILGLVLTGAAFEGSAIEALPALLSFSAGAAAMLAVALLATGRLARSLKRLPAAGETLRRALGVAVLAGVALIATGLDTSVLARASLAGTDALDRKVLDAFGWEASARGREGGAMRTAQSQEAGMMRTADASPAFRSNLPVEGRLPSFEGAVEWLNSAPLSPEQLRGKVVLVDFWTYSCINCIRTLPYVRAWAEKYKERGLVVIGVHTPEFAFEKKVDNVKGAVKDFRIGFPVAVDSNFRLWRAFDNSAWPAFYFADANGNIRHHHFGEGSYERAEKVIQALLAEADGQKIVSDAVRPDGPGAQAAPDLANVRSGETYVGYRQASGLNVRERLATDSPRDYTPGRLGLNEWSLAGNWTVAPEFASLNRAGGAISYRFRARDLHLVLGPGEGGKPVRFQVLIDGKAPGESHGADTDAQGNGTVTATRLYQLVRQSGGVAERTFEVRFLDAGAQAYAFTFG